MAAQIADDEPANLPMRSPLSAASSDARRSSPFFRQRFARPHIRSRASVTVIGPGSAAKTCTEPSTMRTRQGGSQATSTPAG